MSFLPELVNPYVTAIVGGFSYGLVACTSTCLPYVAGYIAGINAGFRRAVAITFVFNLGRITSYALIGAAVGLVKLFLDATFLSAFQTYSSLAFSLVTIAIGIGILLRNDKSCDCKPERREKGDSLKGFDFHAYVLGLSRGLVLCAPMLALLAYSIPFASPIDSIALALLFGLGTAISPILLLGGVTGWLFNKAPLFRTWISRLGAATLIVLGVLTLLDATII